MEQGNRRQQTSPSASILHAAAANQWQHPRTSSSLTRSNSMATPGEYVANLWLLAPARRLVDTANNTLHTRQWWEGMTSSTKPEVHNVFHCRQRRTELHGPRQHVQKISGSLNMPYLRYASGQTNRLAATLRGSRPGVQSASLIMTSLMTSWLGNYKR